MATTDMTPDLERWRSQLHAEIAFYGRRHRELASQLACLAGQIGDTEDQIAVQAERWARRNPVRVGSPAPGPARTGSQRLRTRPATQVGGGGGENVRALSPLIGLERQAGPDGLAVGVRLDTPGLCQRGHQLQPPATAGIDVDRPGSRDGPRAEVPDRDAQR